ncbi:hypothetical protein [Ornithinimicrobium cerasi]|uniref:Lipoprotein n=1 Tax=Ornithinimicrobium cerasi TaxID=2248773 RepID=A0A285VVV4_9MICO|nr:hypothetical protein [Ornithinimicrobium cerasi]SOC58152.1 hypothetical protein SAMN05421879_12312 [Ornithinimicrobium cerasi]
MTIAPFRAVVLACTLVLAGCSQQTTTPADPAATTSSTDPATTTSSTDPATTTQEGAPAMPTYTSQDEALSDARTRAVELRDELAAALTATDPVEAERSATDGRASCTMGGPGPRRWDAGAGFHAEEPREQVAREVTRLEADGWQRVGAAAQTSVTLGRDGWSVTLGWVEDAPGVTVSVGSPCYDEDGTPAG